jgi:hypothetical protein
MIQALSVVTVRVSGIPTAVTVPARNSKPMISKMPGFTLIFRYQSKILLIKIYKLF